MDFTNLKGTPLRHFKFTSKQKELRKSLYLHFANTNSLQELYSDILERFKKYIEEHILTQNYDKDILYYFLKSVKFDRDHNTLGEQAGKSLKVQVNVAPLVPPINILSEYKFMNQVVAKMKKIGYQHLHVLPIIQSSESDTDTSESVMESGDNSPKIKQLRTCQKAIELDCEPMLRLHTNKTTGGTTPHVDILIFMDGAFCKQLSRYLGLIYVEEILEEAEGKQFKDILPRLDNKNSKLYRLLGSYMNKYLIAGYNNVCLVHDVNLWENINANARAVVSIDTDDPVHMKVSDKSNFEIILNEQPSFLTYVEAISMIIDQALNCKAHVIAKYEFKNLYCNVKLSLLAIVPLYVLRYFAHCNVLERKFEL